MTSTDHPISKRMIQEVVDGAVLPGRSGTVEARFTGVLGWVTGIVNSRGSLNFDNF